MNGIVGFFQSSVGDKLATLNRLEHCVVKLACDASLVGQSLIKPDANCSRDYAQAYAARHPHHEEDKESRQQDKPYRLIP